MHPQIQPHQEIDTQDVEAALQSFYSTKVATQEAMKTVEKAKIPLKFVGFPGFPQFEINGISRDKWKLRFYFDWVWQTFHCSILFKSSRFNSKVLKLQFRGRKTPMLFQGCKASRVELWWS